MDFRKIRTFEAVTICVIIVLNKIILNPTKMMIHQTGSSAILNLLYLCVIIGFLGFFLVKVFSNFPNHDILDIANFSFGKGFSKFYAFLFVAFFLLVSAISVRSFVENIKMFYPQRNDLRLLLLFFLVASCLANRNGVTAVTRISAFITPLVVAGIALVFLSVMDLFNWNRIFPLFGYGLTETFLIGSSNIYAFSGLSILFFLPPLLEKREDYKKVCATSLILTMILLLFSISSMILALSFSFTANALSPMYLVIRSMQWGSFFESPEAILTFIFILSTICLLSVFLLFALYIVGKMGKLSDRNTLSFSLRRNYVRSCFDSPKYSRTEFLGIRCFQIFRSHFSVWH